MLIVLLLVPPAAFAIVRNRSRTVTVVFRILLLGLAVPIQAVIVPMFYIMTKVDLYDTLIAVILPTAAFSIPLSTIILTGAMRDITTDLFEAMALDGASAGASSAAWCSRSPGWPGDDPRLLGAASLERLPVSADPDPVERRTRVFTLGLFDFQSTNGIDAPAICAAVVLSIIPMLLVYLFARRWLIRGPDGRGRQVMAEQSTAAHDAVA